MTYYVGANQVGILLRIMDKCSDRRDPSRDTRDALPEDDWRARIEVSLLAEGGEVGVPAALGVDTLNDLIGFRFRDIRKPMFEFFVPTFDGDGTGVISGLGTKVSEFEAFRRGGATALIACTGRCTKLRYKRIFLRMGICTLTRWARKVSLSPTLT